MTKRKRRFLIIALFLAALVAWLAWDGRVAAQVRFAGTTHTPSFAKDYTRLPALLPAGECAIYQIHRGLPHPYSEKKDFVRELWLSSNRSILGYRFYDRQEKLAPHLSERIASILARPDSYHPYIGPKMCGGYHADFAVMLGGDGKQRWILVCLGCGEVLIRSDDGELICELEPVAETLLSDAWGEHLGEPFELVATRLPVPAGEVERMGYKEYSRSHSEQGFGKHPNRISAKVREQSLHSKETEPDSDFPRFILTLREETFATEQDVATRIAQLSAPPVAARAGAEKSSFVKRFFAMGTRVYMISCNESRGGSELPRMIEWLRKHCETTQPREEKQFE